MICPVGLGSNQEQAGLADPTQGKTFPLRRRNLWKRLIPCWFERNIRTTYMALNLHYLVSTVFRTCAHVSKVLAGFGR